MWWRTLLLLISCSGDPGAGGGAGASDASEADDSGDGGASDGGVSDGGGSDGGDDSGDAQPTDVYEPAALPTGPFDAISIGGHHGCALRAGAVTCWGLDTSGQASPPTELTGVVQITAGDAHSCALDDDGWVTCWGHDLLGQSAAPEARFREVDAGMQHTCGIDGQGSVRCWGGNSAGQSEPPTLEIPIGVGAGGYISAAVQDDGQLVCWGVGEYCTGFGLVTNAVSISVGFQHVAAVLADGSAGCAGFSGGGRCPSGDDIAVVSAGAYVTVGIDGDGNLRCWPAETEAGAAACPSGPAIAVGAGQDYACRLDAAGELQCWDRQGDAVTRW